MQQVYINRTSMSVRRKHMIIVHNDVEHATHSHPRLFEEFYNVKQLRADNEK